jgi:ribosomal protein L34
MPLAGFEPTIPVFKRAKTFHALDRAATVTGREVGRRRIKYACKAPYVFIIFRNPEPV